MSFFLSTDEAIIPYGQSSFLPKVQMSGYGSPGEEFLRRSAAGQKRDEVCQFNSQ